MIILAFLGNAAMAQALPPLKDNPRVQAEFLAAAIGDEIRKNCPTISARIVRALGRLNELKAYARDLGYSHEEIEALGKDQAAKDQLKRTRDAYLIQNGVTIGDADSYCRLGYAEIEKKSLAGWLLRAN